MLRLLPKSKVGGIPGPEAYHKKYAQRRRLRRNSLPNEDFRLERLSTNPKQGSFFFKFYLQAALFKFNLQICTLELQSPSFFRQIVHFQVIIMKGWLNYIYRIFYLPNTSELSVVFEYSGFKRATFFAQTMSFVWSLGVQNTVYKPLP